MIVGGGVESFGRVVSLRSSTIAQAAEIVGRRNYQLSAFMFRRADSRIRKCVLETGNSALVPSLR